MITEKKTVNSICSIKSEIHCQLIVPNVFLKKSMNANIPNLYVTVTANKPYSDGCLRSKPFQKLPIYK